MPYRIIRSPVIPIESVIESDADRKLCGMAFSYLTNNQPKKAIAILKGMHKKYPESQIVSNNLSAAYMRAGQEQHAIELTKEIYRRYPRYLYAMINMSHLYLDQGETDKVKEIFGNETTLNGVFPERDVFNISEVEHFHVLMSRYNAMIGNLDEARDLREYLKHINPGSKSFELASEFITTWEYVYSKQMNSIN